MIKILTNKDNYEEYKGIVENAGDVLEDCDYIITSNSYIVDEDIIEKIACRLESYGNKHYDVQYGEDFVVVYHG
jgi:hypothetical protein